MAATTTFHYPPELLELLVEAIPRLVRSKESLMLFFQGAGIGPTIVDDQWQIVRTDPKSISKFKITRTILQRINEGGEATLRERRALLRRVVEFEDFSTCWDKERAKAKGYVADIQRVVNVKDSFTRMQQEKDRQQATRIQQRQKRITQLRQKRAARDAVRQRLFGLFKDDIDPHQRGRDFEAALNELFQLDGISLRTPFRRKGKTGKTVEQIDGAVEIASHLYLVETKWHREPIGIQDVQVLISRLFTRPGTRGIFISASGFSPAAVQAQQDVAAQKTILLCNLSEIVPILEGEDSIGSFFKEKADQAILEVGATASTRRN